MFLYTYRTKYIFFPDLYYNLEFSIIFIVIKKYEKLLKFGNLSVAITIFLYRLKA